MFPVLWIGGIKFKCWQLSPILLVRSYALILKINNMFWVKSLLTKSYRLKKTTVFMLVKWPSSVFHSIKHHCCDIINILIVYSLVQLTNIIIIKDIKLKNYTLTHYSYRQHFFLPHQTAFIMFFTWSSVSLTVPFRWTVVFGTSWSLWHIFISILFYILFCLHFIEQNMSSNKMYYDMLPCEV